MKIKLVSTQRFGSLSSSAAGRGLGLSWMQPSAGCLQGEEPHPQSSAALDGFLGLGSQVLDPEPGLGEMLERARYSPT